MTHRIGILIETHNGQVKAAHQGMVSLAGTPGAEVYAIVPDADCEPLAAQMASYGMANILSVRVSGMEDPDPDTRATALVSAIKETGITTLVGLCSATGKDLLPRIAALLDAPLVMDCFDVDLDKKTARTIQYAGKTMATVKLRGDRTVFGVKPNAGTPRQSCKDVTLLEHVVLPPDAARMRRTKQQGKNESETIGLADADVIIAGGRGMKGPENFAVLFECADTLNAAVGASRAAVDAGWVPYAMQVGQTGEKVSPKVYIACGISGSVQHLAGMQTSGTVIAVNTDKHAPIIAKSDYYVIADALEMVPQLTAALKRKFNAA